MVAGRVPCNMTFAQPTVATRHHSLRSWVALTATVRGTNERGTNERGTNERGRSLSARRCRLVTAERL